MDCDSVKNQVHSTKVAKFPADSRADQAPQWDPTAMLARAEQIIELMDQCYVDESWSPPVRKDADRFWRYFQKSAKNPKWDDQDEWEFVINFCRQYNLSLDWILIGNPGGMICAMLAESESVQKRRAA